MFERTCKYAKVGSTWDADRLCGVTLLVTFFAPDRALIAGRSFVFVVVTLNHVLAPLLL